MRIAKNNNVTMTEARRLLNARELKEFKWSVEDYINAGQQNAVDQRWLKELANASARFHISRLEALKVQTQNAIEIAFGNELDIIDDMARRVYTDDYYRTCYEVQKAFQIGFDVMKVNDKQLDMLISKPWAADGKNFSDRIWQNRTSMVNELHNELVRTCILGEAPDKAIKNLTAYVDKKIKNANYNAGRLVMTEQAFFASAAQEDSFNFLDVEEFGVVATLDSRTSEICRHMDGQHFSMRDFQPGVTAPPFHGFCRSVTVPYFKDEFSIGSRAAREADGKTYYIPENIKYHEWKERFVNGGSKSGLFAFVASSIADTDQKAIFDYMGAKSYVVNDKLRNDEPLTAEEIDFTERLDAALDKMPKYSGELKRSLYFMSEDDVQTFIERYKNAILEKEKVVYNEYISTTKGEMYNPDGQVQITIKNAATGCDISKFNGAEDEVLYKRGASFEIRKIEYVDGKYYILLEEKP